MHISTPSSMIWQRFLEWEVKVSYIIYEDWSRWILFDERWNTQTPKWYKQYVWKSEKEILRVFTEVVKWDKLLFLQKINAKSLANVVNYKLKLN